MLNGYVTFNELKLITGYREKFLKKLLLLGMSQHQISLNVKSSEITQEVYNLQEVIDWILVHLF